MGHYCLMAGAKWCNDAGINGWMEKKREDSVHDDDDDDGENMIRLIPINLPSFWGVESRFQPNRPLSTAVRGRFSMHCVFLHAIEVFLLWHSQNGSQYLIVFPVCKACCKTKKHDVTIVYIFYIANMATTLQTVTLWCFQNITLFVWAWNRNIGSVDGLSLRWACLFGWLYYTISRWRKCYKDSLKTIIIFTSHTIKTLCL